MSSADANAEYSRLVKESERLENEGDVITAFYTLFAAVSNAPASVEKQELQQHTDTLEQKANSREVDTTDETNVYHVHEKFLQAFAHAVQLDEAGKHKVAVKVYFKRVLLLKHAYDAVVAAMDVPASHDIASRSRYASYRIKQVVNAISSSQPIPPPPEHAANDDTDQQSDHQTYSSYDADTAAPTDDITTKTNPATSTSQQGADPEEAGSAPSPVADGSIPPPPTASSHQADPHSKNTTRNAIQRPDAAPQRAQDNHAISGPDAAQKCAKFAQSALMFEDVHTARHYLRHAIAALSSEE